MQRAQLTTIAGSEGYLLRLDPNGQLLWARQSFGLSVGSYCIFNGIQGDAEGNIYVIGEFSGNVQVGPFNLNSTPINELLLSKWDLNGDCIGVWRLGNARGGAVRQNTSGMIYISGIFQNTVNIGSTNLTSAGDWDIFIAKGSAITGQGGNERTANNHLTIYANPNNGSFKKITR